MHPEEDLARTPQTKEDAPAVLTLPAHLKVLAILGAVLLTIKEIPQGRNLLWTSVDFPVNLLSNQLIHAGLSIACIWLLFLLVQTHISYPPFTALHVRRSRSLAIIAGVSCALYLLASVIVIARNFSFTSALQLVFTPSYLFMIPLLYLGAHYVIRGHADNSEASLGRARTVTFIVIGLSALQIIYSLVMSISMGGMSYLFSPTEILALALSLVFSAFPVLVALSLYYASSTRPDVGRVRACAITAVTMIALIAVFSAASSYFNSMDMNEFLELFGPYALRSLIGAVGSVLLGIPLIWAATVALRRQVQLIDTAAAPGDTAADTN